MVDEPLLCPFALELEPMAAMLNLEIADDPSYSGVEIQRFDDPIHGTGIAVLLMRRQNRRVDVYRQKGVRLDRASFDIGAGIGHWREVELDPALLDVTPAGVEASIGMQDADGRRLEVHVDDRDGHRRTPAAVLAPVSATVEHPTSMLFVWMPRFDLVRTRDRGAGIHLDGRPVTTGRLPLARLHRRRLVKYAADLAVVRLNPTRDGPLTTADLDPSRLEVEQVDGEPHVAAVTATVPGHTARLTLEPPYPDLAHLADGASATGSWRLDIDRATSVASGAWRVRRAGGRVDLALDSTTTWRPGPLPLLMCIVTRVVSTFRTWPTTYRWRATVSLADTPSMTSRWERTGGAADEAYRRMMRT